jgi:hypothetical protein
MDALWMDGKNLWIHGFRAGGRAVICIGLALLNPGMIAGELISIVSILN